MRPRTIRTLFAGLALAFSLSGCGKPASAKPATVRGQVLLQSRPLVGGVVVFAPDRDRGNSGKTVVAKIDEHGNYALGRDGDPAPPGGTASPSPSRPT